MSNKILVTSVGWEQRFQLGLKHTVEINKEISQIIYLHPTAFRPRTELVLNETKLALSSTNIRQTVIDIDPGDHVTSWRAVQGALDTIKVDDEIILDMTTMPRQIIWTCLHFLELASVKVQCIYYRPNSYGDWLSGDNGKPKLLFRHSGIAYPDRPTCLLLFSGFDLERTNQIVEAFEPAKIVLITPTGEQLENPRRCVSNISSSAACTVTSLDAYADITALKEHLTELVQNEVDDFNVIATTMGPRCSAVALYALNRAIPEIGLSYASSHIYNEGYSLGIDLISKFESTIDFRQNPLR